MMRWTMASFVLAVTTGSVSARPGEPHSDPRPVDVVRAADEIDRLIAMELARLGAPGLERVDDATFVRRVYLDLVGRIPSLDETRQFLASRDPKKRDRLVDELVASRGFESHNFNYWADLLRAKTRLSNRASGEPYIHFIKQSLRDRKPYDEFVRELLTADGAAHERGNGATGYYLRDLGMPEDNMSNTSRVFLGTRLECAQCHDHPFDKWKQRQFFEMAAFTGGIQFQNDDVLQQPQIRKLFAMQRDARRAQGDDAKQQAGVRQALRRMFLTIRVGISGSGTGLIQLPKDYQYEDGTPGEWVIAKALFGEASALDVQKPQERRRRGNRPQRRNGRAGAANVPEVHSREAYAAWMTSPENPRFTRVIANRMWKKIFGRGLIEPVDDLKDDSQPAHPALMAYLEDLMRQVGYDLGTFQRVLCHTRAYQSECVTESSQEGAMPVVRGPVMRRLTAEQMWDSMLTLVVPNIDATLDAPGVKAEPVYARYEELMTLDEASLNEQVEELALRYTDPEKYRAMQRQQARERAAQGAAEREKQRGELQELQRRLRVARRAKDDKQVEALRAEIQKFSTRRTLAQRQRLSREMQRASDLPSPAPPGHFLREFGQSDREQIEAGHQDASVPQVLSLINGLVEDRLLANDQALLVQEIKTARTNDDRIETLFLALLNRKPRPHEARMWRGDMIEDTDATVHDLLWTLVNSHEFRFVR
ncbi:MAG: DUF1549 domain-containing protein [Planctomycetes bacterium]|nr:DUF1549 domain-containing protein [Planctomycetota bacterium]